MGVQLRLAAGSDCPQGLVTQTCAGAGTVDLFQNSSETLKWDNATVSFIKRVGDGFRMF